MGQVGLRDRDGREGKGQAVQRENLKTSREKKDMRESRGKKTARKFSVCEAACILMKFFSTMELLF